MLPISVPNDVDKYFYNRKKDIKRISLQLKSIEEDLPNQLLITGNRGVGKTFLLKKILHNQPDYILSAYVDISKIYGMNKKISEEEILKEILIEINKTLNKDANLFNKFQNYLKTMFNTKDYDFSNPETILNIPIPKIKDNYEKISKFVMELPQRIVDSSDVKGFIVVIDEFQLIKYVENPEAFFWLFRSYLQNLNNVCYIFTGSVSKTADIIEMINGQTGAFGGRMIQINIDPFTEEETANYIRDRTDIKFTEDGFERFYKCTRGIPAYINTFSNILDSNVEYTSDMIKEVFFLQMDQIVIMWLYVWGNLNDYEKTIIKLIVDNDSLSFKELLTMTKYSSTTLSKYLEQLNNKSLLKYNRDNDYVINDSMLKSWLKNKKETEGHYPV
ncbi:MAG: AAA family ATPase [Methanobrevibacter boviskoreani]|jgi:AAA+ ATPase superfamily predicted ATPase|uniref:AAA family ATPase n=1 Tax=Methanobrevibacter boviskoreani TaxID=1348249 RepID=UPI0023EF5935|nr:ATP-binding protein [Methanobrevibacter boviskoreani]MDD6256597.1 ATP-binding protein [Methanobrevibacter boviskoreani]